MKRYPEVQQADHPRSGQTIRVGDAVCAYRPGVWIVTAILDRSAEYNETGPPHDRKRTPRTALVQMDQVLSGDFCSPKRKAKNQECDIAYCSLVTPEDLERALGDEIADRREGIALLKKALGRQ